MSTIVRIDTEFGPIRVDLDEQASPITTTNFLHYVEEGLYDGGTFHRTVRMDNQSNENLPKRKDVEETNGTPLPNDQEMIEAGGMSMPKDEPMASGVEPAEITKELMERHGLRLSEHS